MSTLQHRYQQLNAAAEDGRVDIVRQILDSGVNPNITPDHGFSALYVAAQNGHTAVVNALLSHGANANFQSSSNETPFS